MCLQGSFVFAYFVFVLRMKGMQVGGVRWDPSTWHVYPGVLVLCRNMGMDRFKLSFTTITATVTLNDPLQQLTWCLQDLPLPPRAGGPLRGALCVPPPVCCVWCVWLCGFGVVCVLSPPRPPCRSAPPPPSPSPLVPPTCRLSTFLCAVAFD